MSENSVLQEEGAFVRSQPYRSLRSFTKFYTGKEKSKAVPSVTEISTASAHSAHGYNGYLWRLSGRRVVYTSDWKRKYFVLTKDRLYYYESENSQGGERGSGVIDLECFNDCVEAPLTDHKKATNVFILIAKERGFFDQGRYYLSAETLMDMKDWVGRIKASLRKINCTLEGNARSDDPASSPEIPTSVSRLVVPEPLYASIKEESIHRSNSLSTLPSLHTGQADTHWANRSMDEEPTYGLGGVEHNLTYTYSSSEDSLNESFSINFCQKQPRSTENSLKTPVKVKKLTQAKPEICFQPFSAGKQKNDRMVPNVYNRPVFRQSSPKKPIDNPDYLVKMYADMDRIDRQLEIVAKMEAVEETDGIPKFNEDDLEYKENLDDSNEGNDNAVMNFKDSCNQLQKTQDMMKALNQQSVDHQKLFRNISCGRISTSPATSNIDKSPEPFILDTLAKYQASMTEMETHARQLILEIQATHSRVVQSLAESEIAKNSFLQLKDKAELFLGQLQVESIKQSPSSSSSSSPYFSHSASKPVLTIPTICPPTSQHPIYAQVRKVKTKQSEQQRSALLGRRDTTAPARNSVAGGDDMRKRREYHLRPRSLVFSKKD